MASLGSDPRVRAGDEPGVWYVKNTESGQVETWRVGENYRLVSVLGCGSFGAVVKSFDARSSRFVALKRVADALTTVDAAKRVLREVVVLNRLDHPNIIKIFDIFFTPATSGARVMDPATFSLVPLSIDLYMAFEIAEGGDLYEMRGEMTAREVRSLMRQLTSAVVYLHASGVWHRDIKSANTLCGQTRVGGRVVKICDFGLARGAKTTAPGPSRGVRFGDGHRERRTTMRYARGDDDALMSVDDDGEADLARDAAREARRRKRHRGSFGGFGEGRNESSRASFASSEDFDVRSDASAVARASSSFARRDMLTTVVATPCYRAPEVIMSNGGYTGAMDVWALGCIFGELLQRQQQHALTPNLTISPLFRFDDDPVPKPGTSETYTARARGDAGTSDDDWSRRSSDVDVPSECARDRSRRETRTKARLDLFFNVIGTPSWCDVDNIPNLRWRRYLRGVRGRAGSITKQFAGCDENSRDLLLRMLAFDPARRASPREVLAHEYFREEEASVSGAAAERRDVPRNMSVGGFDRVESAMAVDGASDAETRTEEMEAEDGRTTFEMEAEDDDAGGELRRFWELSEPRAALAALECAFEDAEASGSSGGQNNNAWRAHFWEWFERECERRTRSSSDDAPKASVADDGARGTRERRSGTRDGRDPARRLEASFGSFEDPSVPGRLTRAFPLFFRRGEKPVAYAGTDGVAGRSDADSPTDESSLSVDFKQRYLGGAFGTTGVFGQGGVGESSARDFGALGDARSLAVAGSTANANADRGASSLGALGHLGANRHGEWGEDDLPTAMKRLEALSPEAWGVTAVPPGMTKEEGDLYRSMSNQQGR